MAHGAIVHCPSSERKRGPAWVRILVYPVAAVFLFAVHEDWWVVRMPDWIALAMLAAELGACVVWFSSRAWMSSGWLDVFLTLIRHPAFPITGGAMLFVVASINPRTMLSAVVISLAIACSAFAIPFMRPLRARVVAGVIVYYFVCTAVPLTVAMSMFER
jgi:hypothetical protein